MQTLIYNYYVITLEYFVDLLSFIRVIQQIEFHAHVHPNSQSQYINRNKVVGRCVVVFTQKHKRRLPSKTTL